MGIIFIFSKVPTARTIINETHKDQLKAVLTIMKRKDYNIQGVVLRTLGIYGFGNEEK